MGKCLNMTSKYHVLYYRLWIGVGKRGGGMIQKMEKRVYVVDLTTADYFSLREKLNSVELLVPFFFFLY